MIPILYEAGTTQFIANGLGRLKDAISCYVTEQRNDEYELEMEYPVNGIHFDLIQNDRIIYAKASEKADAQPFVIYFVSKPLNGRVTIKGEHISYLANKRVVLPTTANSAASALEAIQNNAIDSPFTFYTDKTTEAPFSLDHPETIRKVLGGMQGSILDVYGGEYEWDKFNIKLLAERGADMGVTLRYGKNITDLLDDVDSGSIFTACVPYWKSGDVVKYITGNPVVKSPYYDDIPYGRTISLDCTQLLTSDDPEYVPTDEELTNCALNYMNVNATHLVKESIKVSFIPLYQTEEYKNIAPLERVYLCDWVTVIYEALGINVKMKVTETVYDVLLERYKSVTLGNATRTLAKSVNDVVSQQVTESSTSLAISLDAMRAKLLGVQDSFKYEETDADGNITATYYMDTNDIATAQNLIRINSGGISFSQTGVSGTFTSAWAINGVFNAAFIQTGTMLADRIRGGTLQLGGYNNTSGVFELLDDNNIKIGTWDKNGLLTEYSQTFLQSDYSQTDRTRIQNIITGSVTPTAEDYEKYDFYGDGRINTTDYIVCGNIINRGDLTISWQVLINPASKSECFTVRRHNQYADGTTQDFAPIVIGTGGTFLSDKHAEFDTNGRLLQNDGHLSSVWYDDRTTTMTNTAIQNWISTAGSIVNFKGTVIVQVLFSGGQNVCMICQYVSENYYIGKRNDWYSTQTFKYTAGSWTIL